MRLHWAGLIGDNHEAGASARLLVTTTKSSQPQNQSSHKGQMGAVVAWV